MIIKNDFYTIYFGNSKDNISKQIDCIPQSIPLTEHPKFSSLIKDLDLDTIACLNQTHSNEGMIIDQEIPAFNRDGDYLITAHTNVGLGVLTADCVPAILYDEKNHVIAAIHAGWRGAVAEIVPKTFERMQSLWQSNVQDIQLFIGPSAKACCYQVQENFFDKVHSNFTKEVMIKKGTHWYFDTAQLIALQMQKAGISPASIHTQFNFCTMCDHRFFSHRRQQALRSSLESEVGGASAGRQITIARLY